MTVPDANSLDLTNRMTLEAWVRPATTNDWRTVLLKEQTGQLVYSHVRQHRQRAADRPRVHDR